MQIDHVHFYVENAVSLRDWFVNQLGFQAIATSHRTHTHTEVIRQGAICIVLSSARSKDSPVAQFLQQHPPGVADLAFRVEDLDGVINQARCHGATVLTPIQSLQNAPTAVRWSKIAAWGTVCHTLIERPQIEWPQIEQSQTERSLPSFKLPAEIQSRSFEEDVLWMTGAGAIAWESSGSRVGLADGEGERVSQDSFTGIDHVVLNVAVGDLARAVSWYTEVLGFQPRQRFSIQTEYSGLCSRVMVHPQSGMQLPINEPTSVSSQIQEFLDLNGGAGIQHIALSTANIVSVISVLRDRGITFLTVPPSYYIQLQQRGLQLSSTAWQAIQAQQLLVDWQARDFNTLLLQTFTQPIFSQPTFFFELIERQRQVVDGQIRQAQGFGEGNFRALFEAIEQEQMKRGSLQQGVIEEQDDLEVRSKSPVSLSSSESTMPNLS